MVMRAARGIARKFSGGKSENPNGAEADPKPAGRRM
jgi:hypothetical protein